MAMAKPVVATQLAVEGLGLVDERHYLRAETPADYAAQVRRLEDDTALRVRLAEAGRQLVEQRFAWPAIGEVLSRAWRDATTGGAITAPDQRGDDLRDRVARIAAEPAGELSELHHVEVSPRWR
jgi:hypothetical protein